MRKWVVMALAMLTLLVLTACAPPPNTPKVSYSTKIFAKSGTFDGGAIEILKKELNWVIIQSPVTKRCYEVATYSLGSQYAVVISGDVVDCNNYREE